MDDHVIAHIMVEGWFRVLTTRTPMAAFSTLAATMATEARSRPGHDWASPPDSLLLQHPPRWSAARDRRRGLRAARVPEMPAETGGARNRMALLTALGVDNFGSGLFLPLALVYVTRDVGLPLAQGTGSCSRSWRARSVMASWRARPAARG